MFASVANRTLIELIFATSFLKTHTQRIVSVLLSKQCLPQSLLASFCLCCLYFLFVIRSLSISRRDVEMCHKADFVRCFRWGLARQRYSNTGSWWPTLFKLREIRLGTPQLHNYWEVPLRNWEISVHNTTDGFQNTTDVQVLRCCLYAS